MTTTDARLQELLDKKDEELRELRETLSAHYDEEQRKRRRDEWQWTHHEILKNDDVDLPVPRLEMRWVDQGTRGYNRICWYYLVFRHLTDDIIKVPLGQTKVNGGSSEPYYDGHHASNPKPAIDVPFRDGAHIANEARQLNLPAFVIWKDKVQEIIPDEKRGFELGPVAQLDRAADS